MNFAKFSVHAVPLFISTNILPLPLLYFKNCSILMHDVHNKVVPSNISDFFTPTKDVHHYNTRSSTAGDFYIIFIDMFAPKWTRGPHNLARFPFWDPCITPGYWAWYLNALPTSGSLIRSLFYAFMPREGIYTCVFCPPSSPQRRKPGYAALLRIRGNYFRPYLSIPRVCHRGAAYQWKFSYKLLSTKSLQELFFHYGRKNLEQYSRCYETAPKI